MADTTNSMDTTLNKIDCIFAVFLTSVTMAFNNRYYSLPVQSGLLALAGLPGLPLPQACPGLPGLPGTPNTTVGKKKGRGDIEKKITPKK